MAKILKSTNKNLKNFEYLRKLNDNNSSHGIYLLKKVKNNKLKSLWVAKFLNQKKEAQLEALSQDLFRLILPQQPKTRWGQIPGNEALISQSIEYYVLSKAILNFKDKFFFSPKNNESILNHSITGLAATQVLALWLNEIDFKAGNVGIDPEKKIVIKIDGGLSFISLNPNFSYLHQGNFNITTEDLEALPNLVNYEACNWLQQIRWDLNKKHSIKTVPTELDKKINQSPQFKNELYQTILRIISLPDALIHFFTQCYIAQHSDAQLFSDFIIQRKHQLEAAANNILAFDSYRQSNQARKDIMTYLNYLRNFKTMGKSVLLTDFANTSKLNVEIIIVENFKKNRINNFPRILNTYRTRLNHTIDLFSEKFEDWLLPLDREKITSNIEFLNKIVTEYSASPSFLMKNIFYTTLEKVKNILKKENAPESSLISDFILSINTLLNDRDHLKQKKSLPTLQKNKTIQPSISISFFNKKHQKISTDYHQSNSPCASTRII